jgi:hypothetical protein
MKPFFLAVPVVLVCSGIAGAQDCTARALKTVSSAQMEAYGKRTAAAQRLLKEAETQCPTSARVLVEMSEVYKTLGDERQASFLIDSAARLAPGGAKSAAAAPVVRSGIRRKWALAVGISRFQNPDIPSLAFPAKDAQDFGRFLSGPSGKFSAGQVFTLTNEQATTAGIRTALARIAENDQADDLVVLFFSTHGTSPDMDKSNIGAGYLLTHDADPARLYATSLGMDELARFVEQNFHARRVVVFLDTCFSGDTARIMRQSAGSKTIVPSSGGGSGAAGPAGGGTVTRMAQSAGRVVIASSSRQEQSWESRDLQNGFFTSAIIQALERGRGGMTVLELYSDITASIPKAVREYTKKNKIAAGGQDILQTPQIFPAAGVPEIVIGAASLQ